MPVPFTFAWVSRRGVATLRKIGAAGFIRNV